MTLKPVTFIVFTGAGHACGTKGRRKRLRNRGKDRDKLLQVSGMGKEKWQFIKRN